ncbi:MAG: PHP domain-containing protein [Chloroflexi bacterium]|nr:PHP domain-containing protein [Chloroflexota bacterium]MDA1228490.1 PHP domain-containing protein [Chloroflexota bacterium]
MIIDIHTHTYPTSDDSLLTPEALIDEAKRIGLDGVCLTDHDRFWEPKDMVALSKKHDYLVIPGCEVTTEEGHLLVYGLREYIFGMHKAQFVKDLVDEAGGAIVVAHPYRRRYNKTAHTTPRAFYEMLDKACTSEVFSMVNGVEVFNGRGSKEENAFSAEVAKRFDMGGTGASDAHKIDDIGTFATEFEVDIRDLDGFIAELKGGRFRPRVLQKRANE